MNDQFESRRYIKELNLLLGEGSNLNKKFIDEYRLSYFPKIFFSKNIKRVNSDFISWKEKVILILKNISQDYYLNLFLYPPHNDKKLDGVSLELMNSFCLKFEAHLEALKDIIWKIDEKQHINTNISQDHIDYQSNLELFFSRKSITGEVFDILRKGSGEYVKLSYISKKVDRPINEVRSIINNIKTKIKNKNLQNKYTIEPSRKGSYKLVIS